MNKIRRYLAPALALGAAGLLLVALKLPLWHLRMEAPQYRDDEALRVTVYPGSMRGDLREIVVLNQYIGVHIPETLPQNRWLPGALAAAAGLGILGSLLPRTVRRGALAIVAFSLAGSVAIAVFQARSQMYDIGHKRDAHTKLARVRDFNPPFLGTAKIAQFTVSSSLGTGSWLIGLAFVGQLAGAAVSRRKCCGSCGCSRARSARADQLPANGGPARSFTQSLGTHAEVHS
jgi:hypothetical protein